MISIILEHEVKLNNKFKLNHTKPNTTEAGTSPALCGLCRKRIKTVITVITAIVFWLIIWYAAALHVDKEIILPKPDDVFYRLWDLMCGVSFWISCGNTILRIIAGTFAGIVAGILLAGLMLVSKIIRALLSPLLSAIKATPVASFIIAALFWIGRGNVPGFISFLIVLPVICDSVYTGIKNTDKKLLEMAQLYRFTSIKKTRYIYLPSVVPYFLSALRTSVGMTWKSGVAAEVLCTPADSIGKALYSTKVYMETADMFAWTITIIVLSVVFEKITVYLVGKGLKKYGFNLEEGNAED